jgi:hypothetical protein
VEEAASGSFLTECIVRCTVCHIDVAYNTPDDIILSELIPVHPFNADEDDEQEDNDEEEEVVEGPDEGPED